MYFTVYSIASKSYVIILSVAYKNFKHLVEAKAMEVMESQQ